jgi:hypothetical protein
MKTNTLDLIIGSSKHPVLLIIVIFVVLATVLLMLAWGLAQIKHDRFCERCIRLEELLKKPASQALYNSIVKDYCDLECWSAEDERRVSAINRKIKLKYGDYAKEEHEHDPQNLDFEKVSKDIRLINESRFS